MEKRYTNFGQKYVIGGEIGEIMKIGMDMYIYSWSESKKKTFSKNFCPSAKFVYTKTWERVKIIECRFYTLLREGILVLSIRL